MCLLAHWGSASHSSCNLHTVHLCLKDAAADNRSSETACVYLTCDDLFIYVGLLQVSMFSVKFVQTGSKELRGQR